MHQIFNNAALFLKDHYPGIIGSFLTTALGGVGYMQWLVNRASGHTEIMDDTANINRDGEAFSQLGMLFDKDPAMGSLLLEDAANVHLFYRNADKKVEYENLSLLVGHDRAVYSDIIAHLEAPAEMYDIASHRDRTGPASKENEDKARQMRGNWAHPKIAWLFSFFNSAVSQQDAQLVNETMVAAAKRLADAKIGNVVLRSPFYVTMRWTDANGAVNLVAMPTNKAEQEMIANEWPSIKPQAVAANDNISGAPQLVHALAALHQRQPQP